MAASWKKKDPRYTTKKTGDLTAKTLPNGDCYPGGL